MLKCTAEVSPLLLLPGLLLPGLLLLLLVF